MDGRQHRGLIVFRRASHVIAVLALGVIGAGGRGRHLAFWRRGRDRSDTPRDDRTSASRTGTKDYQRRGSQHRMAGGRSLRRELRGCHSRHLANRGGWRRPRTACMDPVTYEGVCVIAHGPPQGRPPGLRCAASTYGVMCALPIADRRSPGRSPRRAHRSVARSWLSMHVPDETPPAPDSCPPEAPVLLLCGEGCGTGSLQERPLGSPWTRPACRRRDA